MDRKIHCIRLILRKGIKNRILFLWSPVKHLFKSLLYFIWLLFQLLRIYRRQKIQRMLRFIIGTLFDQKFELFLPIPIDGIHSFVSKILIQLEMTLKWHFHSDCKHLYGDFCGVCSGQVKCIINLEFFVNFNWQKWLWINSALRRSMLLESVF